MQPVPAAARDKQDMEKESKREEGELMGSGALGWQGHPGGSQELCLLLGRLGPQHLHSHSTPSLARGR